MTESIQPSPDDLLAALREKENRFHRGQLKIFLGMCPGVGKTYAMLLAAQQEMAEGKKIFVGVIETHGRQETEALLKDLVIIPRRQIPYRGITLAEFDLDTVLALKPQLVLIDELAHTNVPGLRHPKRWQDVIELINAGIDVYTTVNIQHIESRADAVRQITGVPVHETVPDSLLDLADEIELIDITPQTLLDRLNEGKVYLGDRAVAAKDNFFKESHLMALRELSLRLTAERVERQLRNIRAGSIKETVWRSGERLLVAVGPSPFSTQLVRWTRRLAAAQGAPWVAAHIETSYELTPEDQSLLDKNLALARELGAEIVVSHDEDIADALVRLALRYNATQIVVGKPRWHRFLDYFRGTLVDRLIRLGGNIDIYVVPAETPAERRIRRNRFFHIFSQGHALAEYGKAAGIVALITVGGLFLPDKYYLAIGLVYLMAVILLPLRMGRWPVLFAGVFSALVWDFVFISSHYTFRITRVEDLILFVTYFVVALVAGQLSARIQAQARNERYREERAVALFELTRILAESDTFDHAMELALRQIDDLFDAETALLIADDIGETVIPHFSGSFTVSEKELAVATWVRNHRQPAGRFTNTLPGNIGYYLPLLRDSRVFGVLGVVVSSEATLTLAQRDLLEAFARQLAFGFEREKLRKSVEREKLLAQSEKLHRALLDSVSHELRTPLSVITAALENLGHATVPELRKKFLAESRIAAHRLNHLVENLLDQTRLENGMLKPRLEWQDARDIVNAAIAGIRDILDGHPLEISIPDDIPLVNADFTLTEHALSNLLLNAAVYTPAKTPIFITAGINTETHRFFFTVADRGPGVPVALRPRLFEKFSRADISRAGGLGLGLSIVKGFIAVQNGEIVVGENPGGGAVFTVYLPHPEH